VIIDTSAWVEFFRATEKGKMVNGIVDSNPCFTSAISIAEISEWSEKEKKDRCAILAGIKSLSTMIDLKEDILELAGILKIEKRKKIKDFGIIDAIVLATAKQYGLRIVAKDRHFVGEDAIIL
jgi:predicted nucleic acid-binding protein